ncbi:phosphotransferase family protein [Streptomyces sp. JNUCC 64]
MIELDRIHWEELPLELRDAVERETGVVEASASIPHGFNCTVALDARTARSGRLFLKGVRTSDDEGMSGLRTEVVVHGTGAGCSPRLRHQVRAAGWCLLAFDYVDGRYADLGPGTRDLAAIQRAVARMGRSVESPESLAVSLVRQGIPRIADRFEGFLEPGEAELLYGNTLLHTDINPHNILISDDGVAHVIDWAMPALGPEWIDAANTAVWLMAFDHEPAAALAWLDGFPVWRAADPKAVEAYVNALCRQSVAQIGEEDSRRGNGNVRALLGIPGQRH